MYGRRLRLNHIVKFRHKPISDSEIDSRPHLARLKGATQTALTLHLNSGKRSIVVDAKSKEGQDIICRLCSSADAFVSNIRPAALQRLGLGPSDLSRRNSKLIYVSLVGFGDGGPYSGQAAYDDLIQGLAAIPAMQHMAGGSHPQYVPLPLADQIVGLFAVNAVLAALFERGRSGLGQSITVPMFETMAHFVLATQSGGRAFDPTLGPPGYNRLLSPNRRPYRTKDGYICALIYTERHWKSFFSAIGESDRYEITTVLSQPDVRRANIDQAYQIISEILATKTTDNWLSLFRENDIPASIMNDLPSLFDDPHLNATNFFQHIFHPSEGDTRLTIARGEWSKSRFQMPGPAPRLGEHTSQILKETGFTATEIDSLLARGVIAGTSG